MPGGQRGGATEGKEKICPFCKGSGECCRCGGSGKRASHHRDWLGRPELRPCDACEETGKCGLCHGTGKVRIRV